MKKLFFLFIFLSSYSFSEEGDLVPDYFFAGFGDIGEIGTKPNASSVSFDSSSSFLGMGFDVNETTSIQLSYNDFGGRSDQNHSKVEISAIQLGFVKIFPSEFVSFYFRGGFSKDDKDFILSSLVNTSQTDASGIKGYFGTGFLFPISEQANLFFDYTETGVSKAYNSTSGILLNGDISNASIGVTYRLN